MFQSPALRYVQGIDRDFVKHDSAAFGLIVASHSGCE